MRVDLTINIPTIVSCVAAIASVFAFCITIYSDLDKRQMRTDIAVAEIRSRVDRIEMNSGAQVATLRNEMKADIAEIKGLLNRLIFDVPANTRQQQQLREWTNK